MPNSSGNFKDLLDKITYRQWVIMAVMFSCFMGLLVYFSLSGVDSNTKSAGKELKVKVVVAKQDIPELVTGTEPKVYPSDYFNTRISYVTMDRMKFVGFNKYMQNIIYATKGLDDRLYMKSNNPQFLYLEQVKFAGIFEDTEKAAELSCDGKEGGPCDIMDKEFPLEATLIPQML